MALRDWSFSSLGLGVPAPSCHSCSRALKVRNISNCFLGNCGRIIGPEKCLEIFGEHCVVTNDKFFWVIQWLSAWVFRQCDRQHWECLCTAWTPWPRCHTLSVSVLVSMHCLRWLKQQVWTAVSLAFIQSYSLMRCVSVLLVFMHCLQWLLSESSQLAVWSAVFTAFLELHCFLFQSFLSFFRGGLMPGAWGLPFFMWTPLLTHCWLD
jgi:hypothetical protein